MHQVSCLDNGLRVATVPMPHMRSVSVGVWVGVGSRYEPAALNGACHFIEHMLFKGTRRRSARAISEAVEGVGGYLNAYTSEEATCFHARAAHTHLETLLDVLLDMLLHSRFDAADIRKEREVIKEEIAMYLDEPQHRVQELLNATLWPDQPLGRPITGTGKSLDALDRPELTGFLKSNYVAANTVLVVSGRVSHARVLRLVRQLSRGLAPGERASCPPVKATQDRPLIRLFPKATEQTQIALGLGACSRHDPRRFALRLLNTVLGENMSSRLFQTVREDRGLAYSIYSTPSFFCDTGDLVISAGLDPENLPGVLRLILRELRRLKEQPLAPSELRQARDYVIGQIELAEENTETQMNWAGEQLLGYNRIFRPAEAKRRMGAVTAAQIQQAARDFLVPSRASLAVVSPLRHPGRLERCWQEL